MVDLAILYPIAAAFWIMIPAYLPNSAAALCGGGPPIDGGKLLWDGRRVFGEGKTVRGFFCGVFAGICIGLVLIFLQGFAFFSTIPVQSLLSVVLLSTGALLGDLCKSFFKRRLGKERGTKWPLFDMYDLVAGSMLLLLVFDPGWLFKWVTPIVFLVILVLTPILHRGINIIGYFTGVKKEPW